MEDFDMLHDEHQADLFERLKRDTSFVADDLDRYCDVGNRTSYRIVSGSSPLKFATARTLIARHPDRAVHEALCHALVDGLPFAVLFLDESGDGLIGRDVAGTLHELANFIAMRSEHKADGMIEPHERDEEVAKLRDAANLIHAAIAAASAQRVTTRRKAKMRITGAAS